MIDGKRILAVVPARGGSKGIPRKNLKSFRGRSLVALAGQVASEISEIDRRIVSTDSLEIAKSAMEYGLDAPFLRPADLSGDTVSDHAVLTHALFSVEQLDSVRYDFVLMLQPTSPLRQIQDVREVLFLLARGNYDSVWTISETSSKSHPLKQLKLEDGNLDYWDSRGSEVIARQQLTTVYHRNGVAYAVSRDCLVNNDSLMGRKTYGYIIKSDQVSIDSEADFDLANFYLDKMTHK